MISYSDMLNATMTLQECKDYYNPNLLFFVISYSLIILALFSLFFYAAWKYKKYKNFIKDNKLEQHYQYWNNNNKGLN